ncbi:hypothetical protein Q765_13070 [Flavobacterium rivuli WB 3.3-2 = DSM 21788]|uniref:HEPN domain-containing protein n=1 Tax=Flavobacterium rivuli WB 3.3-2 = DSM 21788 TaxID=1121895 RepID=A0A0A2M138_9FLAO|nr:hypothetical protein [Flavobacterium rivuli]KGO85989.1 hypothetical protein Q765_13070 [Flavobacterium rivuli WB 3.3-2 = DSM 21788]
MKHDVLIPEGHPQAHLLEKIGNQILDIVNPDSIFLSVDNNSCPETIFTLIIDTTYSRIDDDLLQPLERIFANHPDIAFRVFSCDYADDGLRKGNLYFLNHCALGKMAHRNSDGIHPIFPETTLAMDLLARTKKHYNRAMLKIEGRYTDFPKCLIYEEFQKAGYTLHQMLEQLFKAAELFLMGKQLFSKDLAEHQDYLRQFAPSLANLFNVADSEEDRLLKLLYTCYVAYRKSDRFEPQRKDIEALLFKTQLAKQEVEKLFKESIQNCADKAQIAAKQLMADDDILFGRMDFKETAEKDAEPNTSNAVHENTIVSGNKITLYMPVSHKQVITDVICKAVKTAAIYCFAMRDIIGNYNNVVFESEEKGGKSVHYYLLVFCYKSSKSPGNDIADTIKTKTKGACTATVLVHKAVRENKYTDQNWFYNSVMVKGLLLYTDGAISLDSVLTDRNDINTSKAGWYYEDRMRIARTLISSLHEDSFERSHDIMPIMLHQVVEQACLGLIRFILGYTPNHFSLSHLFEICSLFTTLTSEFFPQASKVEREMFRLLNTPVWELRYTTHDDVEKLDVQLLDRRCQEFLAHADLFVRQSKGEKDAVLNYYHF